MEKPDQEVESPGREAQAVEPRAFALNGLFVLALAYTIYLTSDVLLPVILAVLLSLLLTPLLRFLAVTRLPHVVLAAVVIFALLAVVMLALNALAQPAVEWMQKAPNVMLELEQKLRPVRETVEEVAKATERVEQMTAPDSEPTVRVQSGGSLRDMLLSQTQGFLAGALITVFMIYFFLASGDVFLRKLVKVLPDWGQKRQAVEIVRETQTEISHYLFTVALINTGLGVVVGSVMYLLGMPNPLLWGVVAGLLNFLPYIGPFLTLLILSGAAILVFDTLAQAALIPAVFLVVTTLEGQLITPLVLGRRLALNPVVVFIGIIFFSWLWGVIGALIAVPILVTAKIVCERIDFLQPVAEFLGT